MKVDKKYADSEKKQTLFTVQTSTQKRHNSKTYATENSDFENNFRS